ncbi:MAG: hypothetical protein AABX65_01890 [Nanoarchaeota archaeon]
MERTSFINSLLFSFFISMSMLMLDAFYHLASNTAVHVNYILVKIVIVFLALFLTTLWIGKGTNPGIFSIILGPVIFYIYYVYADATLNRSIFKLDESFGYVFLHILVFLIAYAVFYNFIEKKKGSKELQSAGTSFILALVVFGVDTFFWLSKVQLQTANEEVVAKLMSFDSSLYLVLSLFVTGFLLFNYIKNKLLRGIIYIIAVEIFIFLTSRDVSRTSFGIVSALIPLILLNYYQSRISK